MHFPSEKVRRYFTDPNYIVEEFKQVRKWRNRNQRREIIKAGGADYEGEVIRSETELSRGDRSTKSGAEREDNYTWRRGTAGSTDYATQRIPGQLENGESHSEDLKTLNALPRGNLGSYHFPFNYLK